METGYLNRRGVGVQGRRTRKVEGGGRVGWGVRVPVPRCIRRREDIKLERDRDDRVRRVVDLESKRVEFFFFSVVKLSIWGSISSENLLTVEQVKK